MRTELNSLQLAFSADRYATELTGINIVSADDDSVVCCVDIIPSHLNAKGFVMGGVIFTLADFAFAVAANREDVLNATEPQNAELHWVSTSSTIHFLTTAKGEQLKAVCHCVRRGNTQCLYQTEVFDSFGRKVALVTTDGTKIIRK